MKNFLKNCMDAVHVPKPDLKMKLFFVLLISAVMGMHANEGYAQKARLTLDMENSNVGQVIDKIELTSEFKFFYKSDEIDLNRRVSLKVTNETISAILSKVFGETNVKYQIKNDQIILQAVSSTNKETEQQFKKLSGVVTDVDGTPLAGVTVLTTDGIYGMATDFDGNFNLNVPNDTKEIIFTYIGFKTKKVELANYSDLSQMNIIMEEEISKLEEVVVTGYQTLAKERSVGSFGQVGVDQVQMRPGSVNILQRLEGTVAGLSIASDGTVNIRGGSSIELNNQPLLVVDGFPIQDGSVQAINPEDVESVNVLKDAAAASIWGVRASNGVIVITTKKGKQNQKLTVEASAFTSITNKVDYSDMNYMSATDQIDLDLELFDKNWKNAAFYQPYFNVNAGLSLMDEAIAYKLGLAPNGDVWTPAQFDRYTADLRTRDIEKDWERYLLRSPILSTYNLSLSTGSEKNSTYASLVYNDNRSAAKGDADNRLIFNLNDTYRYSDKLEFNAGLTATLAKSTDNGFNYRSISNYNAYEDIMDEFGQPIQYFKKYNRWASDNREALTGISQTFNPLDVIRNNDNSTEAMNIRARLGLKAELMKGLVFNSSFQYEKGYTNTDEYQSMNNYDQRIRISDMYVNDVYQLPVGTRYRFVRSGFDAWYFRNTISWDKTIDLHKFTAFAGADITKRLTEGVVDRKYGYDKQTRTYLPVNEADLATRKLSDWRGFSYFEGIPFNNVNSDNREISWYANGAYEFDGKYALNASFRVDQKNLFGSDPAYRYKPLWSAGAGWNIAQEEFMSGINWLNRLRLRASIGVNGNASENSSPYARARAVTSSYGKYRYDFLMLTNPPNPQLRWEETRVSNIGADFSVLNDRLGGSLEYYSKNSKDLLGSRAIDPTVGISNAFINYASMINKGFELSLNGKIIDEADFSWKAMANISYNNNEVTDVEIDAPTITTMVREGKIEVGRPLNNVWSYNYGGLDNTGNVMLLNPDGTTKSWRNAGVTEDELIYHGTTVAPWYGGLSNTFNYKGIDLTVNLVYKFGHVFQHNYGTGFGALNTRLDAIWNDRWMKPGDELNTRVPKIAYNGLNPYSGEMESRFDSYNSDVYYMFSQDNVLDADFVRVRDIILGYTFPQQIIERTGLSNLRFTTQVTNPFLWVKNDRGIDPEAIYSMAYDNLKTFTFGLRATF